MKYFFPFTIKPKPLSRPKGVLSSKCRHFKCISVVTFFNLSFESNRWQTHTMYRGGIEMLFLLNYYDAFVTSLKCPTLSHIVTLPVPNLVSWDLVTLLCVHVSSSGTHADESLHWVRMVVKVLWNVSFAFSSSSSCCAFSAINRRTWPLADWIRE